jgi:hypothetical protein
MLRLRRPEARSTGLLAQEGGKSSRAAPPHRGGLDRRDVPTPEPDIRQQRLPGRCTQAVSRFLAGEHLLIIGIAWKGIDVDVDPHCFLHRQSFMMALFPSRLFRRRF